MPENSPHWDASLLLSPPASRSLILLTPASMQLRDALPDLSVNIVADTGAIEAIGSDAVVAIWTGEGTTASTEVETNGETTTIPAGVLVKIWGTNEFSISDAEIREARLAVVSRTSSDTMEEEAWVVEAFDSDELKEDEDLPFRRRGHPICRCTRIC